MQHIQIFATFLAGLPLVILLASWMWLTVVFVALGVLLIRSWIRISALKNQKYKLEGQLVERSELLAFATERERKALENVALINQSKRQLLSRVNHEVRTPMNGVIGMAALMAETPLTPEQKDYNETIRTCGENLLTVINEILHGDILAHSKLEPGKVDLELKPFDLRNGVEEVLEVFAGRTANIELELLYSIDSQVPGQILGDGHRVRQILMNLVENAVKFTRHGEIVINVQLKDQPQKQPGDDQVLNLYFEIRDTGAGIDPEVLKRLMHSLADPNTKTAPSGGVGLVICQRLVTLMGGQFSIMSKVNEGTTVAFSIQVKAVASAAPAHRDVAGLEGKRVLIVDDNVTSRLILQQELKHWKLAPVVAGSGQEALEIMAAAADIDLVITDLQMPGMDGIALARKIGEQNSKLPILLLSKEAMDTKLIGDLFNSVIHKPVQRDVLHKHIISSLRHHDDSAGDDQQVGQKLYATFSQQYPLKIMIAEDNRVNQKLATKILSKLGYTSDIAQNGKEVLEMVSNAKYDLILMDVQMPAMDGLEATRMIRLCLDIQPVIIAVTANSMQGDREECMNAGMDDYISKPIHLEELVILLEKWALVVKEKQ